MLNDLLVVYPDFNPPHHEPIKNYVWWGWHPKYPTWGRTCWKGLSVEDAEEALGQQEPTYYLALVDETTMTPIKYREPLDKTPWMRSN